MNGSPGGTRPSVWRDTAILAIYCGIIFYFSSLSTLPISERMFPFEDKLQHGSAYAILGWLAWRAFTHRITRLPLLATVAFLFTSMYGISDEWHQSFVPERDPDIWDWGADSTGGLITVLLLYYRARRGSRREQVS